MIRLFKQVFVTVVGIFIALAILLNVFLLSLQPAKPKITHKSVLQIVLQGGIVERAPSAPSYLTGGQEETIDLERLKEAIKHAQGDTHIQAIYLEAGALRAGWAQLKEIREALLAFKKAGKFIISYGTYYTQKAYYLASLADDIVLNPEGKFFFQGLSQTVFFYKSMLEKLEVEPQIFRVGKYKSAVEPFTCQEMSEASRHQSTVLLNALYDHFLDAVATTRKLTQASLRKMADALAVVMPEDAYKAQLVSQVGYFSDAETLVKTRLGLAESSSVNYIPFDKYALLIKLPKASQQQIAVLTAEGVIVDGKGISNNVGAQTFAENIRKLKEDRSIKAVVLRINSPGGSALAAEVLWKELTLLKEKKPLIASMSDVAASGGYYLATACEPILAHPTTITGSIGIFGLFFDANALLRNKLGITTDVVKTTNSADLFSNPGRPLSRYEKEVIQKYIDKGYATFLERVALGRKLDGQAVVQVASGRVWPGNLAQEKGLVDELGGLEEAIKVAAKLANLGDKYAVTYWPKSKNFLEQILSEWGSSIRGEAARHALHKTFPAFQHIQTLATMIGIQARLPYVIEIE